MNNDYLQHYASEYYDPVKAHEYYMQHRKLKGRRPAKNLSEEGKEVWNVTKQNIATEKKAKVTEKREAKKTEVQQLRARAKESRARISEKLKRLNAILTEKAKKRRENISNKKKHNNEQLTKEQKSKIEQIRSAEIPKGLTKEERAKITEQRNKKIDEIRGATKNKKETVATGAAAERNLVNISTKKSKDKNRADAKKQREKVSSDLKSAIKKARTKFESAKKQLDSTYENTYQSEYDKIAQEYPNTKSSTKSTKSTKSNESEKSTVDVSAKKAQLESERKARINNAIKKARTKKNK